MLRTPPLRTKRLLQRKQEGGGAAQSLARSFPFRTRPGHSAPARSVSPSGWGSGGRGWVWVLLPGGLLSGAVRATEGRGRAGGHGRPPGERPLRPDHPPARGARLGAGVAALRWAFGRHGRYGQGRSANVCGRDGQVGSPPHPLRFQIAGYPAVVHPASRRNQEGRHRPCHQAFATHPRAPRRCRTDSTRR